VRCHTCAGLDVTALHPQYVHVLESLGVLRVT